jgi:hypothetical protein
MVDGAVMNSLKIDNLTLGQLRVSSITVSDSLTVPDGDRSR